MSIIPHMIRLTKNVYRRMVSDSIRRSPLVAKLKQHLLSHQMMYDLDYFHNEVEGPSVRGAETIAESISIDFNPKRVIDVGCGTGALLEALRNRGCEVFGLDASEAALLFCRARHLTVFKFDLERDIFDGHRTFDVAVSLEVAEHLPARVANRYVDLLVSLSPIVIFSAAPPGCGGMDHVNEQLPSYWIAKFQQRGFEHQQALTQRWSKAWKEAGTVAFYYYQHLMIFKQASKR